MNAAAKEELYDILFAIGQKSMDQYSPCDWKDGECRRMRSSEGDRGCCEGCKHLSKKGCAVKSLACKLWLCETQSNLFKECEKELKILRQVADYCGVPYEIRRSKEENFKSQLER
jgi:hypothetical protein